MELVLKNVRSENFIALQQLITNPENVINWGDSPGKTVIISLIDCKLAEVRLGELRNAILSFNVTLTIIEEDSNGNPIPQQKIDNLFKALGIFRKK